ncbi:MAG: lysylphosphatidylglycerol synthase transmembrane domain-containing protein, partial [Bryobacteraceae bacterium]
MSEPNEIAATPRPHAAYWVFALALAAILLYFSLRGIAWLKVWTTLRGARLPLIALVLAIISFNLLARSLRWRVVLSADRRVPVPQAFWATAAGYLGNNLLPARAGELVRTLMICARTGMSKVFVLTTVFAERVVDALFLLAISGTILLTLPVTPGWLARAARPVGVIGLAGVAAIVLIPVFETFWHRLLAWLPVPHRFRDGAEHALRQV